MTNATELVRDHLAQQGITAVNVVAGDNNTVVVHPNSGLISTYQIASALSSLECHAVQQPSANRVVVTGLTPAERPDYAADYAHHRAEATRLLRASTTLFTGGGESRLRSDERFASDADMTAAAQVQATLALAAATMLTGGAR